MKRLLLLPLFLIGLALAYQRTVAPVVPILTEEGRRVVFDQRTWQMRELAKRLPPEEPWPTGAEIPKALERFGLHQDTPPKSIPVPARIASDLYLVGQDRAWNLTYLIDCGPEGVAVVDPSFDSEVERTLANIEQCGFSRKNVRWVLNTHCHMDHAMADHRLRELGSKIMVPEADADAVEKGTRVTAFYFVRRNMTFPPSKVDHRLSDGEELRLGNKVLHVIHTPGHTPGSTSFLLQMDGKNILISGDTVLYDGMLGWQLNPYADNRRYLESFQKLQRFALDGPIQFDSLLPGHGAIVMDRAYVDIEKGREMLAGDLAASRKVEIFPHSRPEYRMRMFGRAATKAAQR